MSLCLCAGKRPCLVARQPLQFDVGLMFGSHTGKGLAVWLPAAAKIASLWDKRTSIALRTCDLWIRTYL